MREDRERLYDIPFSFVKEQMASSPFQTDHMEVSTAFAYRTLALSNRHSPQDI